MKNRKVLFWMSYVLALILITSCVDNKYDLDELNPDSYFSPNGFSVALGNVDTIFLKKIFEDENVDGLDYDAQGNYYLVYNGNFNVDLPDLSDFQFNPVDPAPISRTLDVPAIEAKMENWNGQSVQIADGNEPFDVDFSEKIGSDWGSARIDSARMNLPVSMKIQISGVSKLSNTKIVFSMKLPKAFKSTQTDTNNNIVLEYSAANCIQAGGESKTINISGYDFTAPAENVQYTVSLAGTGPTGEIQTAGNPVVTITLSSGLMNIYTAYGEVEVSESADGLIDISSFSNSFKDSENVFSFYNPSILIETESNLGVPFSGDFSMVGKNGNQTVYPTPPVEVKDVLLNSPSQVGQSYTNKYYFARKNENVPVGATFKAIDLNPLINLKPENIEYKLAVASEKIAGRLQFIDFTTPPYLHASYSVKVPFSFGADMQLVLSDTIKNIFDEDVIDYLFYDDVAGGDVIIKSTAKITIPLDMNIQAVILDENGQEIPEIVIPEIPLGVSASDVGFNVTIANQYFKYFKSKKAKSLEFKFKAFSNQVLEGRSLNIDDYILLKKVIFKKTGSIHFEIKI